MTLSRPPSTDAGRRARVIVIDDDRAWRALVEEWLGTIGCEVLPVPATGQAAAEGVDLVLVDLPKAREGEPTMIRQLADRYPQARLMALSTCFFPGVKSCGPVAKALGVDFVLAKPATREAVTGAVRELLAR